MSEPFYPNLQEAPLLQLRVALEQLAASPGYLSHAKCPYSPTIVEFLQDLSAKTSPVTKADDLPTFDGEDDRLDYVETEVVKVLSDLQKLVESLGNADHSEKLAVAKARAGLVEKLIGFREKVWSMKQMASFQAQLIRFLEEECTKDQVLKMKEYLRGVTA